MALDQRLDRGKLDLVVLADGLGGKIAGQTGAAARALVGMMIDEAIEILAHRAAVTLVARLGATRLRLIPTLLAIARRRLRRRPRRLLRTLHPQHQIDQFFLRQTLQINAIHIHMDSGI
jgi:hypothetical protein